MRAVVIEIHKHYCIAVTPDGRFVKQHIKQGELEIGDEIMIETGHFAPSRDWIRTLAIAAAAIVVIGFGSWGMFRVFGWYSPVAARDEAAQANTAESEKTMSIVAEEEIEQEAVMDEITAPEEESEDFALQMEQVEDIPTGPGNVDVDFYLEIGNKGEPVEIIAGNFLFTYWIADSGEGIELLFIIEELDPDLAFTGYVEAIVLDTEEQVAGSRSFDLEEFRSDDRIQDFIPLEDTQGTLNILINGIFE